MTRNSGFHVNGVNEESPELVARIARLRHCALHNRTKVVQTGSIHDSAAAASRCAPPNHPVASHFGVEPADWRAESYTWRMSAIVPASKPVGLTVLPPEDALRSAKPAPTDSELVIDGLNDAEWVAFETALAYK
jgi:hypothetical protein